MRKPWTYRFVTRWFPMAAEEIFHTGFCKGVEVGVQMAESGEPIIDPRPRSGSTWSVWGGHA